jgi:predicted RNA binding protein YcfA (HicA-like mRNA interferase family)
VFRTRLELTHRKPFYKDGFARLYRQTTGTDDCLEEGLASATALKGTSEKVNSRKVDRALQGYVADCPPGDREGNKFVPIFEKVRCEFAEKNQRICLPTLPSKDPGIWKTAPHLFHGIVNIKSHVNYLIFRDSPIAKRLQLRPCLPQKKLIKKLRRLVGLEMVREGARHGVYRTASGNELVIPRHAQDLPRDTLRSIVREAGLDMGLDEFMRT